MIILGRTQIFNKIEKIGDEGIAYIYANNSTAKAIINLDKRLIAEIENKRTFTHNKTSNYFAYTRINENLHDLVMAFYLGNSDLEVGRRLLKSYKREGYQVDHFINTNRTETETRLDNRIENLHLVPQEENKANLSQFYLLPYEFHSQMIEGYFASYMTDGIYEVWKCYDKFSEYLYDRSCFYTNGIIGVFRNSIDYLKNQQDSENKSSQLKVISTIIHNGNIRAGKNHEKSLKFIEEYGITLNENETRLLPNGYVVSNIDTISPKESKEIQSKHFVLINENPEIRKKLKEIIRTMYFHKKEISLLQ